jgi:hypothetical protein
MEVDPQMDLESLAASLIISPNLQHAALVVEENGLYVLVVDGKPWQPMEKGHTPVFSPTSQQIALANFREGQWRMVINGEEGSAYDGMGRPVFSPDGQRLAYSVKQDDQWFMTLDGELGPAYDGVGASDDFEFYGGLLPRFSPDSTRLAYVAQKGNQWFVVVDGQERGPYQAIMTGDLVQGKPLILMDVSPIVFSPDSQRFAFVAQKENQWFLVLNDVETVLPYDGNNSHTLGKTKVNVSW